LDWSRGSAGHRGQPERDLPLAKERDHGVLSLHIPNQETCTCRV
jgi:hypothetical protein